MSSDLSGLLQERSVTIEEDPKRWLQLALYCGATMLNAMLWITYSPIVDEVKDFYDVGRSMVNRTPRSRRRKGRGNRR